MTIDGEAAVIGPDGLSRFDELRRRERAQNVARLKKRNAGAFTMWPVCSPAEHGSTSRNT